MDGNYYEYRFARNNSWEIAPQLNAAERYPAGWSSTAPALSSGKVLWATFALINGGDNTLMEQWCDPYYMTGMTGDNGGSGIPGVGYEVRSVSYTHLDVYKRQLLYSSYCRIVGRLPV